MTTADDELRLFVEHVTHVDCGVFDARDGLRGVTWLVDATLTGARGDDGMLFDFGPAKRLLKGEIDAWVDHRLLVPSASPAVSIDGRTIELTTISGDHYRYAGPETAVAVLAMSEVNPATLARWLEARIDPAMPANVDSVSLDLRAEPIDGPVYDYTHGLSSHGGNCQRLAHGHRCRLAVAIDGVDQPDIAQAWADNWQGIFIGSRADLTTLVNAERLGFSYRAEQGDFALDIAAARCLLLDGPATVENIADHIAGELAARYRGHRIAVRAYEGVGKGAVATRRAHEACGYTGLASSHHDTG